GLQERNLLAGGLQIRPGLFEVAGGLLDRGFIRTEIQAVERLAFPDLVSGLEQPFFDVALDPAAHLDHVGRIGLRRILRVDGAVRRRDLRHFDRRRRGRLVLRAGGAAGGGAEGRENGGTDGQRKPITPHSWFDAVAPSEVLCNSLLCPKSRRCGEAAPPYLGVPGASTLRLR